MTEVTLHFSDKHHAIVAKCAELTGRSVEEYLLHSTESEMRMIIDDLKDYPYCEYTDKDVDEVIKSIPDFANVQRVFTEQGSPPSPQS